ncbi:hypothetical protein ABT173_43910 [Streptomyces sp. NPDC001795]|uniref:hypothetical protein n=1 Tax=unclassified Streptomyces TaxID=2593676 RepID=UPI00331EE8AA
MRIHTWATSAAVAGALLAGTASAAAARTETGTVPWSVRHQTATASGQRWIEAGGTGLAGDLVVHGKLSNTGDGCYSVWTRFVFDMIPGPAHKQAQVCGRGSVDVGVRQAVQLTTTGYLTVCKGTKDTTDCASWLNITSWPIGTPRTETAPRP